MEMGIASKPGLSDEKAQRILVGLRAGSPLRSYSLSNNSPKFKAYCGAHPPYAAEALPLLAANIAAAERRKIANLDLIRVRSADNRRNAERCENGHTRTMATTYYVVSEGRLTRRCKVCAKLSRERRIPTPEQIRKAIAAVHEGEILSNLDVVRQQPFRNFLRQNPKLGSRVMAQSWKNHMERKRSASRSVLASPALMKNNGADAYEAVRCATANLRVDDRNDVMSLMLIAIGERRLKLRDASSRVGDFLRAHRRRPRVFGDARYSLDNPLGDGSSMSWLDTKTDEDRLWGGNENSTSF